MVPKTESNFNRLFKPALITFTPVFLLYHFILKKVIYKNTCKAARLEQKT
jgi:hypothetical protein